MKYIALILTALTLSGCASFGRRSDWYSGPPEMRYRAQAALDIAHQRLQHNYPERNWRKFDRSRRKVKIEIKPTVAHRHGHPMIHYPYPAYDIVRAYRAPGGVWHVPAGVHQETLIHEAVHEVIFYNNIPDRTGDEHHMLFPKAFPDL